MEITKQELDNVRAMYSRLADDCAEQLIAGDHRGLRGRLLLEQMARCARRSTMSDAELRAVIEAAVVEAHKELNGLLH